MVDKVTFAPVTTFTNDTTAVTQTNANYVLMQNGLDNTISRDGTQPNQMNASLDMNSNRILNLASPGSAGEPLRLEDASFFASGSAVFNTMPTGGTAGQVLTKNSSSNYDTSWLAVPGINTSLNYTWTGFHTWNTPKSQTEVISINQQGLDAPPPYTVQGYYNSILVTNDNSNNTSNANAELPALYIQITTGPNANASHYALEAISEQGAAISSSGIGQGDFIGGAFFAECNYPEASGSVGGFYGLESYAQSQAGHSGSTNIASGAEFGVLWATGTTVNNRFGIDIISGASVQGSVRDAAIAIGGGPPSWKAGILLSGGLWGGPLDSAGAVITTDGQPFTIAKGISLLTGITITGNAWESPGITLTGLGGLQAGTNFGASAGGSGLPGAPISVGSTLTGIYFGTGAPTLSAPQGSIYLNTTGSSTSTRMYVNTNGSTGWTNFVTAT